MRLKRVLGFILVITMAFTAGVGASSLQKNITVLQDFGVSVKVDGYNLNLGDKAPLMYNGTTYLPVRSVAEAIGKPVNWNNDTRTVILGVNNERVKLTGDMIPNYMAMADFVTDSNALKVGEHSVKEGFDLGYFAKDDVYIKLDSKYTKMTFTVIVDTDEATDVTLNIYNIPNEDDKLSNNVSLLSKKFEEGVDIQTYEVDITNKDLIKIEAGAKNSLPHKVVIVGDIYFQ